MMKKILSVSIIFLLIQFNLNAQTITPVVTGLLYPAGMAYDSSNNIYITEAGTGQNDGRISMVHSGVLYSVVDSLPSVYDSLINDIVGPWRCYISSGILTVIIGGKQQVNMGSIISWDISTYVPGAPALKIADALDVFHVASWALNNGFVDSDIFSAAWDSAGNTYISDAGANAIFKRDVSNNITVVDTFPQIPNTISGFPPFIDYVPTKIINGPNNGFYVCNLSGFPFFNGLSSIVSIDSSGIDSLVLGGLSLAVDMYWDNISSKFIVLQFGSFDTSFLPVPNSAVITSVDLAGNTDTLATGFGPSAGMLPDYFNGFYVTDISAGILYHIDLATAVELTGINDNRLDVFPNPFSNQLNLNFHLNSTSRVSYEIVDMQGRKVDYQEAGTLPAGLNTMIWNRENNPGVKMTNGVYFLNVYINNRQLKIKVVAQ